MVKKTPRNITISQSHCPIDQSEDAPNRTATTRKSKQEGKRTNALRDGGRRFGVGSLPSLDDAVLFRECYAWYFRVREILFPFIFIFLFCFQASRFEVRGNLGGHEAIELPFSASSSSRCGLVLVLKVRPLLCACT